MRIAPILLALLLSVGGCIATQPPPLPPPLPPTQAVDRVETEFFVAERIWPSAERALFVGQEITITLRILAKKDLEYAWWREVIGRYSVMEIGSQSDMDFMILHLPMGKTYEWRYDLVGYRAGKSSIDGVIKAVSGPISVDSRLFVEVSVYDR